MKYIKLFEKFQKNDYDKIEKIIPFIIQKHEQLIKWANKKFNGVGSDITELCFEYSEHLDSWSVVVISENWNNNINRHIQYVFEKEVIKYADSMNLNIKCVIYAVLHNPQSKKYVIFDIVNDKLIKK